MEINIFRGIFDKDLGVSGLLGDLLVDSFSCLMADFFTPPEFRSLLRMGEAFIADFDDDLIAASASAFLI